MDNNKLAELLFPHIDKTPEYYENLYPERNLGEGATAHMHRIASVSERTYTNVLRKNSLKWVLRTLVSAAKKSFRKCAKHRCLKSLISDIMMNGLYAAILNMTRSKRR